MSDALDYFIKVRPDAARPYFQFLKASGRHLDTRTRDLISVITKVATQSERGLRQYLPRALRNGATPHEIIDALLMAFPVLGLTKILWAIDVILDMDIPEFHPELIDAEPAWHAVAPVAEIPEGEAGRFDVGPRSVFVYREGDRFHVYDSRCPHQVTDIPHLALDGERLTCPRHGWVFDITTGACVAKGRHPLRRFETKVEAGVLHARW
ncbi:Rieske 2Fe-2S domain-containing protein [Inmirania thermothiophila]|uniref:Nitrite reductase/ring-hydroxylating ferredoxin subunit n=1 Tax=Inmirania thermothiophila TaxID=1750597 RepID=A0A3N1Y513_9GAMM|nr:Rieske 2Fe-2S domain-containing protein [Inmirania thermothiophila]ROR32722.1 nitrite reductase/ring-hydroxylating ferredoxin subunit [Inmirania thermothiophila]